MMHMQSKKKELEHNIANCPNEALKNRFRAELLSVVLYMQSKKKELEHNMANCPNEALKNRFRAELLSVVLCDLFCEQSELF